MLTRTLRRTRQVSRTVGGKTHEVDKTFETDVPVVPKDWDAIAMSAVRAGTTLAVLGAMAWSTVSIGDLLSRVAPVWTAYTVAGVFDLAWIVCMILEWLARNDPERASLPRKAGWAALAISMGLIGLHGWVLDHLDGVEGALGVGIGGALVSAIAKSMWSVVMDFGAVELSEEDRGWLKAERAEVGTELAMTRERRQLARTRSTVRAERLALGQDTGEPVQLTAHQVVLDRETEPVPAVQDRTPRPRTVVPIERAVSVSSYVLSLLDETPDMDGTDIRTRVRSRFGQDTSESGIAKAITRARSAIKNTGNTEYEETGR